MLRSTEEPGCCEVPSAIGADPARCPLSATIGQRVELVTVKALLRGEALRRLDGRDYRFCPEPDCGVVYFDNTAGSLFRKEELTVRVGQKEKDDPVPLCYCFGYREADVRRDLAASGRTEIPAIITAEVKAGHCACEVKNPQGTCCLGSVSKAVRRVEAEISGASADSSSESGAHRANSRS